MNGKYRPLYNFLSAAELDEVQLSFKAIEAVLGAYLPPSARSLDHGRQWWANNALHGHVQACAWLEAGYFVRDVDVESERVTFFRPVRRNRAAKNGRVR